MKNLNLTPRAQKLIKEALDLTLELKHQNITHLHLFVAFLSLKQSQIEEALLHFNYNTEEIKKHALSVLKEYAVASKKPSVKPLLSEKCKLIFKAAKGISSKYDHKYIGLEHLFIGMFEISDDVFDMFLDAEKNDFIKVLDYIEQKLEEDDLLPQIESTSNTEKQIPLFNPKKYKNLNNYATNLNTQVISGKINNLHINKDLIQKISEVLCRKNKNNPLIVGEAGVGKTALVESLAQAIVENKCSDFLVLKQIYSLDISMMIAGCKYRGEFEEKIKNLLKEIVDDPYIILFIDEIHTIIGAGNPQNGLDVANILKPYLARGEISCIGATTFDEYKKTIEDDPALSRRFQMIKIEEPNKEQVFELLKNIKHNYEQFHIIEFSDDILKYIVDVSEKYLEGRFPDKALDIIDQVGAKVKLKKINKTNEMIKIEGRISKLALRQNQMSQENYLNNLQELLSKYQASAEKMVDKWKNNKYKIQEDDILSVIADKTNIPIDDLKKQDLDKIKILKIKLNDCVLGQQNQTDQIYKCLLRAKAGFRNFNKPICSMLFAGPTGVGKTMTAKIIAETLFINKNNFISIDMSEYADKTAVNKLIGSSPGYIGFDKGGVLTEKVRKNPYCLILLDEIQKADEDVLFLLLQILEEGKISDSSGKIINFSNSIIIMTTNIGTQAATTNSIGFGKANQSIKNDVSNAVKKYFAADLLNRLDELVTFDSLNDELIKEIVTKELSTFKQQLKDKNINVNYSDDLRDFIFKKIQFNNFGARQVIKTIQRELQTLIAEKVLENSKTSSLEISVKDNNICVI